MKNKIWFLLLALLIISCKDDHKKDTKIAWKKKHIFNYIIDLPSNYSVRYTPDSTRVLLTNDQVKINFIRGYFDFDGIDKSKSILSSERIASTKKIIFDSTFSHQTSIAAFIWDTAHVIHLFKDAKFKGCNLVCERLNTEQKDTVLEIFKSLVPDSTIAILNK